MPNAGGFSSKYVPFRKALDRYVSELFLHAFYTFFGCAVASNYVQAYSIKPRSAGAFGLSGAERRAMTSGEIVRMKLGKLTFYH